MSLTSIPIGALYALLAGVLFGVYLFVLKRYLGEYHAAGITAVVYGLAFGWYGTYLTVFHGVEDLYQVRSFALDDVLIASAVVVCFVGGLLSLYTAISRGDVSYVAPLGKVTPIIVLPLEILLLGELLTPLQITGIVCTTLAVYVANYQSEGLFAPFVRAVRYRPAQLALVSAALIAVFQLGQRFVLQEIGMPIQLWVLLKSFSVGLLLCPAVRHLDVDRLVKDLPIIAASSLLIAVGEVFAARGFATVSASIASPLLNLQAIVAVVLGGVLLREEAPIQRFIAASLAVVGVGLIAL